MRQEFLDNQQKWFVNKPILDICQQWHITPFFICDEKSLQLALSICQGFIIPGGYDMHSFYYGEPWNEHEHTYQSPMDHFDLFCIHHILQAQKPLLGICRGIQVINTYFKGTLYPHLTTSIHPAQKTHKIEIVSNTFCSLLYPSSYTVNSFHHQAIQTLGKQLLYCAKSEDGIIEAIQHETLPIIAVQWHPELCPYDPIFSYFFDSLCK